MKLLASSLWMEDTISSGMGSYSRIRNYTDEYEGFLIKMQRGIVIGCVHAAFIALFFVIGLPWNALVIGIILRKKLFTQPPLMLMPLLIS